MAGGIEPPATDTQERQKGHKRIDLCPNGLALAIEAQGELSHISVLLFDSDPFVRFDPPAPLVRFVRFSSQERWTSSYLNSRQWPKNLNWGVMGSQIHKM